jgi:hypothetical protein
MAFDAAALRAERAFKQGPSRRLDRTTNRRESTEDPAIFGSGVAPQVNGGSGVAEHAGELLAELRWHHGRALWVITARGLRALAASNRTEAGEDVGENRCGL